MNSIWIYPQYAKYAISRPCYLLDIMLETDQIMLNCLSFTAFIFPVKYKEQILNDKEKENCTIGCCSCTKA